MLSARDFDLARQLAMFAAIGRAIVAMIVVVGALVFVVRYLYRIGRHC